MSSREWLIPQSLDRPNWVQVLAIPLPQHVTLDSYLTSPSLSFLSYKMEIRYYKRQRLSMKLTGIRQLKYFVQYLSYSKCSAKVNCVPPPPLPCLCPFSPLPSLSLSLPCYLSSFLFSSFFYLFHHPSCHYQFGIITKQH